MPRGMRVGCASADVTNVGEMQTGTEIESEPVAVTEFTRSRRSGRTPGSGPRIPER